VSVRTFCIVLRELSSWQRTLSIVLEELSGVRQGPMIISMPTMASLQQCPENRSA
jgi:hypothetical protein